jgi:hypothetical protein
MLAIASGASVFDVAYEAHGEERAALWGKAVEFFEGFTLYEQRTNRPIPIFVLEPQEPVTSDE